MFQTYEEDFGKILNSLQRKIDLAPSQSAEVRESAISEGSKEVMEAEKCLRQMEIELSMMQAAGKGSLSSQVRRYRDDFEDMKRKFRKEETKFSDQKSRDTLMGARLDNGAGNHKEKLLQREENALSQQIMKLEQGKKAALDAEGVAIETMNQLKIQREVLDRAVVNNREVADNLSQGNRVLNAITRRSIQNKLIMFGVVILLIGAIVVLVYLKIS